MLLDAGVLVSVDRGERAAFELIAAVQRHGTALHTTEPVVAQVWREGARQVRLGRFLHGVEVHPLADGRSVGALLARAGGADVVDAHLVVMAIRLGVPILTGDVADIERLARAVSPTPPRVFPWP